MDILFVSRKIEKLCNDAHRAGQLLGADCSQRLRRRLDDLYAADSLSVMRGLPGRCHELTGQREGQLSLDLVHPQRLLFEPADVPRANKPDGGIDWERVRMIRILGIEDTHD